MAVVFIGAHRDRQILAAHDMLTQTTARAILVIFLHAHHGDGELNPGKDNPVGDPENHNGKQPLIGMRHQMPQIGDIEPKQHGDEGRGDAEPDGDMGDVKANKLGHWTTPLPEPVIVFTSLAHRPRSSRKSPGFTGSLIPEAQVFFVPYLLPQDTEKLGEFFRTSKAINEMFPELYAEQGLELLTMFPEGEVCMTTQEPVTGPPDLDQVKFRVMTNPLLVESYKAFGATPTPLPWGEVYGALQTGIIQGQENPAFWIHSTKMYEVSPVITCIGHNNFTTALMANQDFYDGLGEGDQQVIQDAVDVAFEYILEYQRDLQEESLAKIKEAKPEMEINILSEEERQPFMDTAPAVEEAFVEMTGEGGQEILDQMKADLEAAAEATGG